MKSKISTLILILCCLIGLALLLYPTVADYWNSMHTTHAISNYVQKLETMKEEDYKEIWDEAVSYNREVAKVSNTYAYTDELAARYEKCLDITGQGVMGYIEISKIKVALPIYHGTGDDVLQMAVGHVSWSSLPVGGESTHCVLSGHRGLASAKLFTDLDVLREGDTFTLNILNEVLTYEIDQIRTVLPEDTSELTVHDGKDYCTLVTCTPYGINSHRLLVRGHRIENKLIEDGSHVVSEAVVVEPLIVAPVLAAPLLIVLIIMVLFKKPDNKKKNIREQIKNYSKKK